MIEYSGILGLIILILDIWAIVTILASNDPPVRKVVWIVVVLILPVIGLILWFLLGRR
jgi:hypothetical protein